MFENLIGQVGEHQKEGGELVSSEDMMSLFRPLIPDTEIKMETRLLALNLLEKVGYLLVLSTHILKCICMYSAVHLIQTPREPT